MTNADGEVVELSDVDDGNDGRDDNDDDWGKVRYAQKSRQGKDAGFQVGGNDTHNALVETHYLGVELVRPAAVCGFRVYHHNLPGLRDVRLQGLR